MGRLDHGQFVAFVSCLGTCGNLTDPHQLSCNSSSEVLWTDYVLRFISGRPDEGLWLLTTGEGVRVSTGLLTLTPSEGLGLGRDFWPLQWGVRVRTGLWSVTAAVRCDELTLCPGSFMDEQAKAARRKQLEAEVRSSRVMMLLAQLRVSAVWLTRG